MCYFHRFRCHPAPSHSPQQINPKQLQTHRGYFLSWTHHNLQHRTDPVSPDLPSLFVMAVPCCVFSSKGPSVSICPSLLLLKCVISPSHHRRASKTAHRYTYFQISGSDPTNLIKKKNTKKKHKKETEKKT